MIESHARQFETTYLFELSDEALLVEVSRIPSDAIVIALTVFRDATGKSFVPAEVASTLANLSPAPVYAPYINQLGNGVVGAYSETFDSMGRAAADIVLEILSRQGPGRRIPPRMNPGPGVIGSTTAQCSAGI